MNGAITWEAIAYIVMLGGAVGGVWWRLQKQLSDEREVRILSVAALKAEMAVFKLEVAEKYATNSAIREVEERVVQAIDRLGDRLDRFLERSRNQA